MNDPAAPKVQHRAVWAARCAAVILLAVGCSISIAHTLGIRMFALVQPTENLLAEWSYFAAFVLIIAGLVLIARIPDSSWLSLWAAIVVGVAGAALTAYVGFLMMFGLLYATNPLTYLYAAAILFIAVAPLLSGFLGLLLIRWNASRSSEVRVRTALVASGGVAVLTIIALITCRFVLNPVIYGAVGGS
ncbi:general stress protein CsbA [Microbacterium resistens]|uniref:General stress protein CsbA n=1 Tax=Microbacterium resistens TaxID=156977 RepID=A0ABU1S8K0_9MICO|nr:hypothetical protein [Microbacterium resistens]MDR6865940.1 general stress protein CsbA [Microbacterium resistens]